MHQNVNHSCNGEKLILKIIHKKILLHKHTQISSLLIKHTENKASQTNVAITCLQNNQNKTLNKNYLTFGFWGHCNKNADEG